MKSKLLLRLTLLACLASLPGLAANWRGALVDAKCYASMQRNVNPAETHPASTDTGRAIRYCSPNQKTKWFAIVQQDGVVLSLDPTGNQKAAALFLKVGKRSPYPVHAKGEKSGDTLNIDEISPIE
jgi:hypothetical protein